MTASIPDPTVYRDRACNGVDQDVFFATDPVGVEEAQAICRSCPRLAECAQWALPQVLAGLLTDAVVAGVQMPPVYGRSRTPREQLRRAAAAGLTRVVTQARAARMEGAA